jgi:fumarylacetoacetate (FAA) hydrolase
MKLVTFRTGDGISHAGIIQDTTIIPLHFPTLLDLLRSPDGLDQARAALSRKLQQEVYHYQPGLKQATPVSPDRPHSVEQVWGEIVQEQPTTEVVLLPPITEPPTLRDFYAFEQHVKAARAQRNAEMIREWYEIPIFYFSNTSELYGHDSIVPYPTGSEALDFELEIACVIGREGKNIPVEEAEHYIAGYMIMNDWSARDLQRKEMRLNLGPGKGKDFATSLGPWLVTPDELSTHRTGSGASERYDLTMLARVNGKEVSRGNFKDIYYSFPQMIAYASRNARLRVGDVLGSGTVGTGCILELGTDVQRWLRPNDVVELEIEGIGILCNKIM